MARSRRAARRRGCPAVRPLPLQPAASAARFGGCSTNREAPVQEKSHPWHEPGLFNGRRPGKPLNRALSVPYSPGNDRRAVEYRNFMPRMRFFLDGRLPIRRIPPRPCRCRLDRTSHNWDCPLLVSWRLKGALAKLGVAPKRALRTSRPLLAYA